MNDRYRTPDLGCPVCFVSLEPREVDEAVVDVCPSCGGLWVDWFDGDLVQIARLAPRIATTTPARPAHGEPHCPRCRKPLVAERFTENSPVLLRCGDCAGAFVSRAACDALTESQPGNEELKTPSPTTGFAALLAALKDLFRKKPPKRDDP